MYRKRPLESEMHDDGPFGGQREVSVTKRSRQMQQEPLRHDANSYRNVDPREDVRVWVDTETAAKPPIRSLMAGMGRGSWGQCSRKDPLPGSHSDQARAVGRGQSNRNCQDSYWGDRYGNPNSSEGLPEQERGLGRDCYGRISWSGGDNRSADFRNRAESVTINKETFRGGGGRLRDDTLSRHGCREQGGYGQQGRWEASNDFRTDYRLGAEDVRQSRGESSYRRDGVVCNKPVDFAPEVQQPESDSPDPHEADYCEIDDPQNAMPPAEEAGGEGPKNNLKLFIFRAKRPDYRFGLRELNTFVTALGEKISSIPRGGFFPRFQKSALHKGAIVTVAADPESKRWLLNALESMRPFRFDIEPAERFKGPNKHRIFIYVREFPPPHTKDVLYCLETQNPPLKTDSWRIIFRKDLEKVGMRLTVAIDQVSLEVLQALNFKPYIRASQAKVTLLDAYLGPPKQGEAKKSSAEGEKKEPQPLMQQLQSLMRKPQPLRQQPWRLAKQPQPPVQPQPLAQQPQPPVQQPQPQVQQPQSLMRQAESSASQGTDVGQQPRKKKFRRRRKKNYWPDNWPAQYHGGNDLQGKSQAGALTTSNELGNQHEGLQGVEKGEEQEKDVTQQEEISLEERPQEKELIEGTKQEELLLEETQQEEETKQEELLLEEAKQEELLLGETQQEEELIEGTRQEELLEETQQKEELVEGTRQEELPLEETQCVDGGQKEGDREDASKPTEEGTEVEGLSGITQDLNPALEKDEGQPGEKTD